VVTPFNNRKPGPSRLRVGQGKKRGKLADVEDGTMKKHLRITSNTMGCGKSEAHAERSQLVGADRERSPYSDLAAKITDSASSTYAQLYSVLGDRYLSLKRRR